MSNRYQTLSWVTGTVNAGSTLTGDQTVGPSLFNIVKIKIVPDSGSETFNFRIYKDAARTKRLIRFEVQVPNLYQPVDRTAGLPGVEMYEGVPFPYDDDDGTGKLHWEFVNNGVSNHTFTVTVLYEEVPLMDASGNATYRGSVSYPSVTAATIYGGTAAGSTLTLAGTSNGSPVNAHILLNAAGQGNVGVGTSSPLLSSRLNVKAASLTQASTNANVFIESSDSQAANLGGSLALGGQTGGTGSRAFAVLSGRKENSTDSSVGGYLAIATPTAGGAMVERMRVDSAGVATFSSTGQFVRLGLGAAADANHLLFVSSGSAGYGIKILDTTSAIPVLNLSTTLTSGGNVRNWIIAGNYDALGEFTLRQGTSEGSDPYGAGGATKLRIRPAGHLAPGSDNSQDLGDGSGGLRWRTGYFGTSLQIGTNPAGAGLIRLANNGFIYGRNAANNNEFSLLGVDGSNIVTIGSISATTFITGAGGIVITQLANASLAGAGAGNNGLTVIDSTNNRFVYYSGGNRYYLAGTSF